MLTALRAYLDRRRFERQMARVKAWQDVAWHAYQDAKARGDTRDMHCAWPALKTATTERLRLEVEASSKSVVLKAAAR